MQSLDVATATHIELLVALKGYDDDMVRVWCAGFLNAARATGLLDAARWRTHQARQAGIGIVIPVRVELSGGARDFEWDEFIAWAEVAP